MNGFSGMNMGWGMGFGWIIGCIILIAAIWFIVKTVNQNNSSKQPKEKSPLDILNEKYARGEINKQEYEGKKKDIL